MIIKVIRWNIKQKARWFLIGILIASALFHILYLLQLRMTPFISQPLVDADVYHQKAITLLKEGWLGDNIFFQAPLYPYLLAIVYQAFGPNIEMVVWIQAVCSVCSIYLIYLIGQRLFSIEVGIVSAWLASFYGVFIFYSGFLLKVSFSILFTCIFLLLLLKANQTKKKLKGISEI